MVVLPRSRSQDCLHRLHTDIVMRGNVIMLLWVLSATVLSAPHQHKEPVVMAPGYAPLSFTPPGPGTYGLPSMGLAGDGQVLNSQGNVTRLHD